MKKAALLIVVTLFSIGGVLQFLRILASVYDPVQLDYVEGVVLWQTAQVFHLERAFHPGQEFPLIGFGYTPFYHVVVNLLSRVIGDQFHLLTARLVSMFSALWIAGLLAWTVYRASRRYISVAGRIAAAVITGSVALQLPSIGFVPQARVDIFGLALEFTGLCMLILGRFRLRTQVGVMALMLLGLYTKQSLLAVPIATLLLIFLIQPVRGILLGAGLAFAGSTIFLAFAKATGGASVRSWIVANYLHITWERLVTMEMRASANLFPLVAGGMVAIVFVTPRAAIRARLLASRWRRLGIGMGLVLVLGFLLSLSMGRPGSNINYCLEWQLALCSLFGAFIVLFLRTEEKRVRSKGAGFAVPFLFVLLVLATCAVDLAWRSGYFANRALAWTQAARTERDSARSEDAALVRFVSNLPGEVVSDNLLILLRSGKAIQIEPAGVQMATEAGIFDERELLARTSSGFFDAFIVRMNEEMRYSPAMQQAIEGRYQRYPFPSSRYVVAVRIP